MWPTPILIPFILKLLYVQECRDSCGGEVGVLENVIFLHYPFLPARDELLDFGMSDYSLSITQDPAITPPPFVKITWLAHYLVNFPEKHAT